MFFGSTTFEHGDIGRVAGILCAKERLMRKRDRLKKGLRRLLGRESATDNQASVVAAPEPNPAPVSDQASLDVDSTPVPKAQPAEQVDDGLVVNNVTNTPNTTDDSESTEEEDAKAAEMAAKAAKHFERTRVAMLKFVVDQGGTAGLADMHDLSERRYFIGHKRFSTLMEGLVEEGLIDFDHGANLATVTANGKAYIDQD